MSDYYRDMLVRLSQHKKFKFYYRGYVFYVDAVIDMESGDRFWIIGDKPDYAGNIHPCYSLRGIRKAVSNYLINIG